MKKTKIVLFRHGKRFVNTHLADGPLTADGISTVSANARILAHRIPFKEGFDVALVSSSIRCVQTFSYIWSALLEQMKHVRKIDVSDEYYCIKDEERQWQKLYERHRDKILEDERALGEKEAILKHAGPLVTEAALRTIGGINRALKARARTILLVGHEPHLSIVEEAFTRIAQPACLKQGEFKVITPLGYASARTLPDPSGY